MKKLVILLSVAALAFGTISCKKPVDPVTPDDPVTPVKRIARIDEVITDSLGVETIEPQEVWNWEGNVLKSIDYPSWDDWSEVFTYENGHIASSIFDGDVTYFTYNGDKLVKMETTFMENDTIGRNYITYSFEYQGDRISKIVVYHQTEGDKALLNNPLRFVLPQGVSDLIMENMTQSIAKATRDGGHETVAGITEYTMNWDGNNVTKIDMKETYINYGSDETEGVMNLTYDDKHNPMQGIIYFEKMFFDPFNIWECNILSPNNVLTSQNSISEGTNDNHTYQYTYDADGYPTDYTLQWDFYYGFFEIHDISHYRITYVE